MYLPSFPVPQKREKHETGGTKFHWDFKGLSTSSQLRDGAPKTLISSNPSPQKQPASARERERGRAEESSDDGEKLFSSSSWEPFLSLRHRQGAF
jgi:hypothetical protein